MRAVWLVRSRQMATEFAFWLAIAGYNRNDRSLSHRIYLAYAGVFFVLWGFAVLSLLAGMAAAALTGLGMGSSVIAAARVSLLVLLAWGLYKLFTAARRTPIVFSEEDSYLICQTPVSRRAVAFAWLPLSWISSGLPFWAGAVVLGFAQMEVRLQGHVPVQAIPSYALSGLRAMIVVLFMHLALLALDWAAGTYRLKAGRWLVPGLPSVALLRWLSPLLVLFLGGLLFWSNPTLGGWNSPLWQALVFPLLAAYGTSGWLLGLALTLLSVAAGLALLAVTAPEMSLIRAAQESAAASMGLTAALTGNADEAAGVRERQKLGAGARPSTLPAYPGILALPWKQFLQARRVFHFGSLAAWLSLFGAAVALALIPGWGPRLWIVVAWVVVAGQAITYRLRRDLMGWWLLRQMPFSSDRLLLVELVLPWALVVILTWVGLALGAAAPPVAILAVPGVAACSGLAASYDILRKSKTSLLLTGSAPGESFLGAVLGLLGPGITAALAYMLGGQGLGNWIIAAVAGLASLSLAGFYWSLSADALRRVS